jgi:hypothetical protein
MQRTDARIGGSWPRPAARCWPVTWHVRAVLDQLAGAVYDRLGSRLLAGSLRGVAFESAPVVLPGVRARNRGEGWVMAARKAREGYELGPR